jgi:hypothetical protein
MPTSKLSKKEIANIIERELSTFEERALARRARQQVQNKRKAEYNKKEKLILEGSLPQPTNRRSNYID